MTSRLSILAVTTALTASLTTPTFAQTSDNEVIVTATKRTTTLQETPLAISVTDNVTIENARIQDLNDLQSVDPSLRVNQLQTSTNTNFIIRGFGNGANNAGIESSVGVFVDGVYRSRSAARIGDLPKLDRIEVLRGPQSTLFGKNASAGVISIVTAKPSAEKEGYAEFGYGNYNNFTGKAYYTNAIGNGGAAFSLGGGFNMRDGYAEAQPGLSDLNDRNRWNIQGQLSFEPSDKTSVRIIADYSTLDEVCCAITNFQNEGAINAVRALGGQTADANDPFAREHFANKDSVNEVDDWGISAQIDHDLGFANLTSITAYRNNDTFFDSDSDFTTLEILETVSTENKIKTFNGFLEKKNLKKIKKNADLILASNVFAHADKLKDMADCMLKLLGKNGTIIIEIQYLLNTLKDLTFDNIYHEHYNYWSLTSLVNFFNQFDAKIFRSEMINTHGGSLRIYIKKDKKVKIEHSVKKMLKDEEKYGIKKLKTYQDFGKKVYKIRENVIKNLKKLKENNNLVIGYGAPAKATTALNFFGVTKEIDFIVEDNKLKHNKFVPGVKIPIKKKSEIKNKKNTIVVLAWNFFKDIQKNNSELSDKFINIKDLE